MNFPHSWIRTNVEKAMLLKAAYRFRAVPIKIPKMFTPGRVNSNFLACSCFSSFLTHPPPTHTHPAFLSWISSLALIFNVMIFISISHGKLHVWNFFLGLQFWTSVTAAETILGGYKILGTLSAEYIGEPDCAGKILPAHFMSHLCFLFCYNVNPSPTYPSYHKLGDPTMLSPCNGQKLWANASPFLLCCLCWVLWVEQENN